MENLPFVSIIFPTRNRAELTLATLASLQELDYPKERLEILIWDNGSTDGSPARLREALEDMGSDGWWNLRLVEHQTNLGVGPARDRAFRLRDERAAYILCIDDDVELAPDCLRQMVAVFAAHPQAGVVGARVVYFDRPEETQSAARYMNRITGRFTMKDPDIPTECDSVIGCGQLIKADAFNSVDGFDYTFYTDHEEVDFCLRLKEHGYGIYFAPGALIKHKVAPGGRRTPERIYYTYRNKIILLRRHTKGLGRLVAIGGHVLLGIPKAYVDAVRHHRGLRGVEWSIIGRAFWDGLRGDASWRDF
ncbi:MAG: glycosyltransferase family 2 protein [Acidobacteriota bacterium]